MSHLPLFISHIIPIKEKSNSETILKVAEKIRTLKVGESICFIFDDRQYEVAYVLRNSNLSPDYIYVESPKTRMIELIACGNIWPFEIQHAINRIIIKEVHSS